MIIKIDADKFVEIDDSKTRSSIISKNEIEKEVLLLEQQIASIPPMPSDAELLAWARSVYPNADVRNRDILESHIGDLNKKLEKLIDSNESLMTITKATADVLPNP